MKIAHRSTEPVTDDDDLFAQAEQQEKNGELKTAASLYLRYLKKIPGSEQAYSRLMIIYRKQKDPAKELEIIDKGIKTFQEIFQKTIKVAPSKKTIEISKKLMKSMGLTDKKGKELFEREPLAKWNKRKMLLEKRQKNKK
ncbi:MAG: hypothetical protein EOO01_04705 [Chitinophagaceae bacterium]|nr:MAG: hypothetical protein EOO01_04705 [Chitinophagaceae bacterium]